VKVGSTPCIALGSIPPSVAYCGLAGPVPDWVADHKDAGSNSAEGTLDLPEMGWIFFSGLSIPERRRCAPLSPRGCVSEQPRQCGPSGGTPRIDRDFRPLRGYPLGIGPWYVQRDDHTQGMVRYLSLARRGLTLVKYVVMSNPTRHGRKRAESPGLTLSLQERDLARLAESQPSPLA
jgi:hypothetical protein